MIPLRLAVAALGFALLGSDFGAPQAPAADPDPIAAAKQVYTSDLIVFLGGDSAGRAIFALDTNRGRDGREHQAEHFGILHVEGRGWVELAGNGEYPNPKAMLDGLPDSAAYRFSGTPKTGWTIEGAGNSDGPDLKLTVEPLIERTRSTLGSEEFVTASAAAVLTLGSRSLRGQAIHEWTRLLDKNLITDPDTDTFGDGWHGAYLTVGERGLLRAHLTDGDVRKLLRKRSGFYVDDKGAGKAMDRLRFEPGGWSQGRGLFRWPTRWSLNWDDDGKPASAELSIAQRETILNWGVGAFAVAIVEGSVEIDGRESRVYGLGQILR